MDSIEQPQTPWLSIRAAALYLGLRSRNSYKSLARWAKAKKIIAGHTGRSFVFRAEDLDKFLLSQGAKVRK